MESAYSSNPTTVLSTNIVGVVFGLILFWLVYVSAKKGEAWQVNLILVLLGGLIGWVLGVIAAPYNSEEAIKFTSLAQTVSAFASGYLVSKVDRFLEECLFKEGATKNAVTWTRVSLFACALLIGFILVFTNRNYYHDIVPTDVRAAASGKATATQQ